MHSHIGAVLYFEDKNAFRRPAGHGHTPRPFAWTTVCLVFCIMATGAGFFTYFLQSKLKTALNHVVVQAEHTLGMPLSADLLHFQFGSVEITGLKLGKTGAILLSDATVDLHINPFSEKFGYPKRTTFNHVKISVTKEALKGTLADLHKLLYQHTQRPSKLSTKQVHTPTSGAVKWGDISIRNLDLNLISKQGETIAACSDCALTWNTRTHRIDGFGQLEQPGILQHKHLMNFSAHWKAHDRLWSGSLRVSGHSKSPLLTLRTSASTSSHQVTGNIQIHIQPDTFDDSIQRLFTNRDGLIRGQFSVSSLQQEQFIQSQWNLHNIAIQHPTISRYVVGPWDADMRIDGHIRDYDTQPHLVWDGLVSLHNHLPNLQDGKGSELFKLSYLLDSKWKDSSVNTTLTVHMPRTSCSHLSNLPTAMLGVLKPVSWQNSMSGDWQVNWPDLNWNLAEFSKNTFRFDCVMDNYPHALSPATLNHSNALSQKEQSSFLASPEQAALRTFTPLEFMSRALKTSIVASEDRRFWKHQGIEMLPLISALKLNLEKKAIIVGASTISMQTAKNLFLDGRRTLVRKFQEALLTHHLEHVLSKKRILEIYLNIIEFGPDIFGIQEAARIYFNKAPDQLNLVESNFLAHLLPSPRTRFQSYCQGSLKPIARRDVSQKLKRLQQARLISAQEYSSAKSLNIQFAQAQPALCRSLISKKKHYKINRIQ